MNKGTANSSGEWIIFMNAGDTFYDRDTIKDLFSSPIPESVKEYMVMWQSSEVMANYP